MLGTCWTTEDGWQLWHCSQQPAVGKQVWEATLAARQVPQPPAGRGQRVPAEQVVVRLLGLEAKRGARYRFQLHFRRRIARSGCVRNSRLHGTAPRRARDAHRNHLMLCEGPDCRIYVVTGSPAEVVEVEGATPPAAVSASGLTLLP